MSELVDDPVGELEGVRAAVVAPEALADPTFRERRRGVECVTAAVSHLDLGLAADARVGMDHATEMQLPPDPGPGVFFDREVIALVARVDGAAVHALHPHVQAGIPR